MATVATAIIIQMYIIIIEPQNKTEHPINMLLVHMQKKIKAAGGVSSLYQLEYGIFIHTHCILIMANCCQEDESRRSNIVMLGL